MLIECEDAADVGPITDAMIEWIDRLTSSPSANRILECGNDDLVHPEHRLRRRRGAGRVGVAGELEEPGRNDLPAQPEPVLEPAALRLLAAVDQPVPVVVDLVLVLALDQKRHRLAERELR